MGLFSSLFNKKSALDGRGDLFQFYDDKLETYYYVMHSFQQCFSQDAAQNNAPRLPIGTRFLLLRKQKERPGIDYLRNYYTVYFDRSLCLDASENVMENGTVAPTGCSLGTRFDVHPDTIGEQIYDAAIRGYFSTHDKSQYKALRVCAAIGRNKAGNFVEYAVFPHTVTLRPESNKRDVFISAYAEKREFNGPLPCANYHQEYISYIVRPRYNSIRIICSMTFGDDIVNDFNIFAERSDEYHTLSNGTTEYYLAKTATIILAGDREFRQRS